MIDDEKQDRRLGRLIVLYRVVAVAYVPAIVAQVASGNHGAAVGLAVTATLALIIAGELQDRRVAGEALREAHAALAQARAEILASHANLQEIIGSVTEEQMRAYFGLPQKEQR